MAKVIRGKFPSGEKSTQRKSGSQAGSVYQLKVTLDGIKPPVWRRIMVPGGIGLDALHLVIQNAMGWSDSHLHQFHLRDGTRYSVPDPEFESEMGPLEDERRACLCEVAPREKSVLVYEYDFGDGWQHQVWVEKISQDERFEGWAVCIEGARACPPEDCGGRHGYAELLQILNNPKHREHAERLEWLGGPFDPEAFDLPAVNSRLRGIRLRVNGR